MNSSSASGAVPAANASASGAEEGGLMKSVGSFFGLGGGKRRRASRRGGKRRGGKRRGTRRNRRNSRRQRR